MIFGVVPPWSMGGGGDCKFHPKAALERAIPHPMLKETGFVNSILFKKTHQWDVFVNCNGYNTGVHAEYTGGGGGYRWESSPLTINLNSNLTPPPNSYSYVHSS